MNEIDLYEAIDQMRILTDKGEYFSFIHATYNRDTMKCNGKRLVRRAKLRPAARKEDVTNADYKLFYYDFDEQLPRVCWQPLIMYFNGKKVNLN